MKKTQLDLNDLVPQESKLILSGLQQPLILRKFSLFVQLWAKNRFPGEKMKTIFSNECIPEISELAYFMVKNKDEVKTLEDFQDAIVTQKDRENLILAIIQSVGVSQPLFDKLTQEELEKNDQSLSQPTGAQSTTESPQSITTP